jgi:alcohol dehydrogenase (cytochrome c)
MIPRNIRVTWCLFVGVLLQSACGQAPPPSNADWPSYNGDLTGRRYSPLSQITTTNVHGLTPQWIFHASSSDRLEGTPIVIDGIMFMTAANDAWAIDARTGRTLWHYARPVTEGLIDDASAHHSRGAAVWQSRVYLETDNAHLVCLDLRSGHVIWDVEYADTKTQNYGATSVPLIVKNLVLVGTSGGDDAVRGFLAAFDANSGALRWKLWTIPGPGEPGSESWPGELYLRGGGTTWMPGTYDPELNTLYWGTGNAAPDFDGSVRPGDDLYTACLLAIDPDTGSLKWHFQFTPHDVYDYDAVETPVLIDETVQGQPRKLVVQANRNGFLYVLDRTNGAFLSATPFLDNINWARGIDPQGRPLLTGAVPTAEGTKICPGYSGGTNWYAPSYNPATKQFYFLSYTGCDVYYTKPQTYEFGKTFYATGTKRVPGETDQRILLAYDLRTHTFTWRYPQARGHGAGGTMTTAGGLTFFGDDSESFEAVEASSGRPLWHFTTGQPINASPMTYALGGRQYVAIAAGADVISFALPSR